MSEHVEHHFGEPMEPDLDGSDEPMQQHTIGDRMPHTRATMSQLKGQIQYGSHHHYSMYADLFSQKWINMNISNQSQTYYTKR